MPLIGWVAGAFLGGLVAALVARKWQTMSGTLVGLIILSLGGTTMMEFRHPAWFILLALLLVVPAGWLGGTLAERRRSG
jgi:hypothetical protein